MSLGGPAPAACGLPPSTAAGEIRGGGESGQEAPKSYQRATGELPKGPPGTRLRSSEGLEPLQCSLEKMGLCAAPLSELPPLVTVNDPPLSRPFSLESFLVLTAHTRVDEGERPKTAEPFSPSSPTRFEPYAPPRTRPPPRRARRGTIPFRPGLRSHAEARTADRQ